MFQLTFQSNNIVVLTALLTVCHFNYGANYMKHIVINLDTT